ncbi:MAG: hypothetical protein KC475_11610, partial [Cyanobacteria bacterium HKST-UBA03]|nr:hypothetical protein [Cyanobacteria bacterium HKST-UBA03]
MFGANNIIDMSGFANQAMTIINGQNIALQSALGNGTISFNQSNGDGFSSSTLVTNNGGNGGFFGASSAPQAFNFGFNTGFANPFNMFSTTFAPQPAQTFDFGFNTGFSDGLNMGSFNLGLGSLGLDFANLIGGSTTPPSFNTAATSNTQSSQDDAFFTEMFNAFSTLFEAETKQQAEPSVDTMSDEELIALLLGQDVAAAPAAQSEEDQLLAEIADLFGLSAAPAPAPAAAEDDLIAAVLEELGLGDLVADTKPAPAPAPAKNSVNELTDIEKELTDLLTLLEGDKPVENKANNTAVAAAPAAAATPAAAAPANTDGINLNNVAAAVAAPANNAVAAAPAAQAVEAAPVVDNGHPLNALRDELASLAARLKNPQTIEKIQAMDAATQSRVVGSIEAILAAVTDANGTEVGKNVNGRVEVNGKETFFDKILKNSGETLVSFLADNQAGGKVTGDVTVDATGRTVLDAIFTEQGAEALPFLIEYYDIKNPATKFNRVFGQLEDGRTYTRRSNDDGTVTAEILDGDNVSQFITWNPTNGKIVESVFRFIGENDETEIIKSQDGYQVNINPGNGLKKLNFFIPDPDVSKLLEKTPINIAQTAKYAPSTSRVAIDRVQQAIAQANQPA